MRGRAYPGGEVAADTSRPVPSGASEPPENGVRCCAQRTLNAADEAAGRRHGGDAAVVDRRCDEGFGEPGSASRPRSGAWIGGEEVQECGRERFWGVLGREVSCFGEDVQLCVRKDRL